MAAKTRKSKRKQAQLFNTLGHEIRLDALRIFNERVASPNEISNEIGANLSLVSHHVQVLLGDGSIELVKTEPRRGAVEHYYRARVPAMIDDKAWQTMPQKSRLVVYRTILQSLMAESAAAEAKGAFDADDAHLSWMPFPVDEQGHREMTEVLADALERIGQVKAGSAERLAESDEAGQTVIAAMMGFQRAPSPGKTQS